jgi:ubiquinone/menaquinone biosynthesis C-methylase UbiE
MGSPRRFFSKWLNKAYRWATEQLYGPFAWAYEAVAWLVSFGYWSTWRLDALAYARPGSVLEIGFGPGELLITLAGEGRDVVGLEPSPQMHQVTRRKLDKQLLYVNRVCAVAEAMPFPSETFDNLISTFPSNYILDEDTLKEMMRVIRRQGRCVVLGLGVELTSKFKRWLTHLWLGAGQDVVVAHFKEIAEGAGFKVMRVDHQTDAYTLPVLILEKQDDD